MEGGQYHLGEEPVLSKNDDISFRSHLITAVKKMAKHIPSLAIDLSTGNYTGAMASIGQAGMELF